MNPHPSSKPILPVRGKSLATQLTWVSILMVILSLAAVGTGLIIIAEKTQQDLAFRLQQQTAEKVSQLISGYMTRAVDRLAFFLDSTPLALQPPGAQGFSVENLLISSLPLYSRISVLDKDGNERCKISRFHTFLPEELMNQAQNPAFSGALGLKNFVGPVAFLEDTGLLSVPVALPIMTPAADVAGVMIAEVNVSHLWQRVARIEVGQYGYAYLVNKEGRFVAYQKPAQVLQRYGEDMSRMPPVADFVGNGPKDVAKVHEYKGLMGETVIGVYAPIKGTDWAVVVEQPTREAYASIRKMTKYLMGLAFLCTLLAGGVGFYVSRRIIGPIRTLTAAALQLGTGDLETEFKDVKRQDEVGVLSHAFKKMQKKLRGLYTGIERKITELETTQEALKESEAKFRTLVEESPLGIALIGRDGRYKYINPRFRQTFGYTLEDIPTGSHWLRKAFPKEADRREVIRAWVLDLKQREPGPTKSRKYAVTCKDGSRKQIHFRPVIMDNLDRFVICEDVTEKLNMERQLQQAQKLEAIGTLAGGIAHDFNNLLMGIQGRISLMSMGDRVRAEHVKAIEAYVKSATGLTRQLLGIARGGKYEVKPVDLNALVVKSAEMFGRTRKEIQIQIDMVSPSLVVEADPRQVEQVLLNLFVNAWQAMPEGGTLKIKTEKVALDTAFCKPHQVQAGAYGKIRVMDTGIGMDDVTRRQIFDPFFTTKEKQRGTGLGLASAYGIVRNHGGVITVKSAPGRGTAFTFYLPASDEEVGREVLDDDRSIKGSETILLVDDEEMIIDVGQAMLEHLGYRVVASRSGEEAVETVKKMGNKIDLVLLDMIMPGMDGGKTFDSIREIHSEMQVILSSGYSIDGQAKKIMDRGCNGFIQKPFGVSTLSQKLREILDI
ncbi:MAG: response regulator [Deltaproteobacteria bacterium]|nr:response regulator [Deltaproteobacteria bacterium]